MPLTPSDSTTPRSSHHAVLLGATGAVGGEILKALCARNQWQSVTTLGRRPIDFSVAPWSNLNTAKVKQEIVNVLDPSTYAAKLKGHTHAFCAFGIGQPTQVSRQTFLEVDFHAPMQFAQACKQQGIQHFSLMTSVGSNSKLRIFYIRTKGELEEGVIDLSFERTSLFRPSTLVTPTNRYGMTQGILLALTPFFNACLHGTWKKFRGIRIEDLGQAMVLNAETERATETTATSKANSSQLDCFEWPDFMRLIRNILF